MPLSTTGAPQTASTRMCYNRDALYIDSRCSDKGGAVKSRAKLASLDKYFRLCRLSANSRHVCHFTLIVDAETFRLK